MAAAASFDALYHGYLKGLLQWRQFDDLWTHLRAHPEGWYVRDFSSKKIPDAPMGAEDFRAFLDEAETFLRRRHREDYCGFIYLDDIENPTFIKVFDPRKMGSACSCSTQATPPRWTISRLPPVLTADMTPPPEETPRKKGLLARLFGG